MHNIFFRAKANGASEWMVGKAAESAADVVDVAEREMPRLQTRRHCSTSERLRKLKKMWCSASVHSCQAIREGSVHEVFSVLMGRGLAAMEARHVRFFSTASSDMEGCTLLLVDG
ncbi:hypothetical protein GOP47_0021390 [Adiantum capillus-veneris]|uniref:Uncharacterized protein n=1 Tax=Adiantum capillus-veneris TaxID=13818 RepID=A0A9D4Z565_ADICA|nr:hypothetical protein GOP47_0021390 [Adiantum capillus-veneris]